MTIKRSQEKPVNYPHIEEKFGKDLWERGVVITYGDTIHCKNPHISPQIIAHEEIHVRQQLAFPGGPAAWWREYIRNDAFRLQEELEGHKHEASYVRAHVPNRRKRADAIDYIHRSIASNYGGIITYEEASRFI